MSRLLPAPRRQSAVRTLLLANVVMWTVTIVFPIRSEILPLAIGFFIYLVLAPVAEASEQTIIQRVVPFQEPVLALSVCPTSFVPVISGGDWFDGGVASPSEGSGSGAPGIVYGERSEPS